jgi:pimeloyl-ACP methyl ester carboxylesterase
VLGCRRGTLRFADGGRMDWLQLGRGSFPAVVVPGVGDGLWTIGQSAVQLAWRYRRRFWTHRLLIVGRREPIPSGFGVEEHADDYLRAVERLGWGPSVWECISAGGPIGQCVARRRPDVVRGLILASTTHRLDAHLRSILVAWRDLARNHRWTDLYWSMATLNSRATAATLYQPLRPLLAVLPAPRSPQRILRVLDGLTRLDNSAVLPEIRCSTLIVGGEQDRIISAGLQREMAGLIPHSRLVLYAACGHAAPRSILTMRSRHDDSWKRSTELGTISVSAERPHHGIGGTVP